MIEHLPKQTEEEQRIIDWLEKTQTDAPSKDGLDALLNYVTSKPIDSLGPFLPIFLNLKGKPYSLDCKTFPDSPGHEYIMMDPMFRTVMIPARTIWKCGRQVSKTTTLSALAVMQAATYPYLNMLFVAPLHEQIKKISSDNIKPFIEESSIKKLLINSSCTQNVLKREFLNKARMYFTFAFLSTDRVRGISADLLYVDEIQSIDKDFLPIIDQCISASRLGRIRRFTGTPLTIDNTIEALWEQSSQAEWVFPCDHCNKWNTPNLKNNVERMIGKETIICAYCQKPINPVHKLAHWKHLYPEKQLLFSGYHLPQIILPLHYANSNNWQEILWRRENEPVNVFLNECLGESSDVGERMLSQTDIQNVSVLGPNTEENAKSKRSEYSCIILSVDWGGYGRQKAAAENRSKLSRSYTTFAVTGMKHDLSVDCIYCGRFYRLADYKEEISFLTNLFDKFKCNFFAHDYAGSGDSREVLMIQSGLPVNRIIPFVYTRATSKPIISYIGANEMSPRHYYSLDKTRSLRIMTEGVKTKFIRLPSWESCKDITQDLLALVEEKLERYGGPDMQLVIRKPGMTDDFCHALNYGCMGHWHLKQEYPNFAKSYGITISSDLHHTLDPESGMLDM